MSALRKILDVGNCDHDHGQIIRLFSTLGAEVTRATTIQEALQRLQRENYALVLVNRKIDQDNSDGIGLIQAMQANPTTKPVPVMLISNFPDAQEQAKSMGAVQGFGKDHLNDQATKDLLRRYL